MTRLIRVGIVNDTRNAHHMGCWLVMRNLFRLLSQHEMQVEWCWPTGRDWRKDRHLDRRGDVDLVLVNAEGSIHDSHEHPLAERFASIARHFSTRFQVPSVLINATLHNNEPSINEMLRDYALIFTRDSASARLLDSVGIEAQSISDLTLAFRLDRWNDANRQAFTMVTDSASRSVSQELEVFAHRTGSPYRPIQFARFPHPHRLATPRRYLGKARRWVVDKIVHRPGLDKYIGRIRDSALVITGRYHAVTMCLLTATPFLAVESSIPKISWALEDAFGTGERVFRKVGDIGEDIDPRSHGWSEHERARLEHYLDKCQSSNQRMMAQIRNIV